MGIRRLLCFLALSAGTASAKLEVRDVEHSHGQLGPRRENAVYVRGDEVYVRFNVLGATTDDEGRINGEMKLRVLNAKTEEILTQTGALRAVLALGGDRFPARAEVTLGEMLPAGTYALVVEVTDLLSKETCSFRTEFTCKETEFSIVALRFFQDADGNVPAPVGGVVNQTLYLHLHGVGFDRSQGEIDLVMTVETLDGDGKPLMKKPIRAVFHNEDGEEVKKIRRVKFTGEMRLHRPGTFRLRVTLKDTVAKKTATFEAPLRVVAP